MSGTSARIAAIGLALSALAGCSPGHSPNDPLLGNQLSRARNQAGIVQDDRVKPEQLQWGASSGVTMTETKESASRFKLVPARE